MALSETEESAMTKPPKGKAKDVVASNGKDCLYPGCINRVHSRGLCNSHYQQAWKYIKAGLTTWEELEAAGRVREPRSDFKSWLLGEPT